MAQITKEQIQQEIQQEVKEVLVSSMEVVKRYVDEHSIDNEAKREELKNEIADAIAEQFDFEGERDKIEKAANVAETLLGIFDTDEDGTINPQEFLDKLNSIYAQLETTNQIKDDLLALAQEVGGLKSRVEAVEANFANYFTKSEIAEALAINKEEIVTKVAAVFYPNVQEDGVTL